MSSIKHIGDKSMSIKQNDYAEVHLKRLLQRYFDVRTEFTANEREMIALEVIARIKQSWWANNGWLFSLNRQMGDLCLDAAFFGIEDKFTKRTAFNKDFEDADNNQTGQDYIVSGDDPRLSNERDPIDHVHSIDDVITNEFDNLKVLIKDHIHSNQNVLDIIDYTGDNDEFDLSIVSEQYIDQEILKYTPNLEYIISDAIVTIRQYCDLISLEGDKCLQLEDRLNELWDSFGRNKLQDDGLEYVDTAIHGLKTYVDSQQRNLILAGNVTDLENELKKIISKEKTETITASGSISYDLTSDTIPLAVTATYSLADMMNSFQQQDTLANEYMNDPNGTPDADGDIEEQIAIPIDWVIVADTLTYQQHPEFASKAFKIPDSKYSISCTFNINQLSSFQTFGIVFNNDTLLEVTTRERIESYDLPLSEQYQSELDENEIITKGYRVKGYDLVSYIINNNHNYTSNEYTINSDVITGTNAIVNITFAKNIDFYSFEASCTVDTDNSIQTFTISEDEFTLPIMSDSSDHIIGFFTQNTEVEINNIAYTTYG